jgi:hypothetical protein
MRDLWEPLHIAEDRSLLDSLQSQRFQRPMGLSGQNAIWQNAMMNMSTPEGKLIIALREFLKPYESAKLPASKAGGGAIREETA